MDEPERTVMTHRSLIAVVAVLVVVVLGTVALRALQSRPADPLAPSSPAEVVARTARLAGIERAVTAEQDGTARVAFDVPRIVSAADVELTYQLGFAALASAWPAADVYVVRLRLTDASIPLVEFTASGPDVRDIVEADAATALLAATRPELLAGVLRGGAESPLPAEEGGPESVEPEPADDAAYLDAMNRAAGFLGEGGPQGERAERLSAMAGQMRQNAPRVPAPTPGQSAADIHSARIRAALTGIAVEGTDDLAAWLESVPAGAGREDVALMRAWAAVAEALRAPASLGSVLADAAALAGEIAETPFAPGPPSDAVLAAAGSPAAPDVVREVRYFQRVNEFDWNLASSLSTLPGNVLTLHGTPAVPPALAWGDPEGGTATVAPDTWLAYQRVDGRLYWLAGPDGPVALTDASLLGWAFSVRRAALVDAGDVEYVRAIFRVE